MVSDFKKVLERGISYILSQQQKDGGFLSLSSPDPFNFKSALTYHTTFTTSLILLALKDIPADTIKSRAAKFLLKQKSKHWSFNYWARGSKESLDMRYPDDLDDTFCAVAALLHIDNKIIDGEVLAKIVMVLTSVEEKEGGPYRTWLVNKDDGKWQDVDLAVNSNIAYFLSLFAIELPNLVTFIESKIKSGNIKSPYYPSFYPIIYFISRLYKGRYREKLKTMLLKEKDKNNMWENPLYTALALLALINLDVPLEGLEDCLSYLLKKQKKDGSWDACPFYLDPSKDGVPYYSGSYAMTTAFCLEALYKYTTLQKKNRKQENMSQQQIKIYKKVITKVEETFKPFDISIKEEMKLQLKDILEGEKGKQIPLLPYYFNQSLGDKGKKIHEVFLIELGCANVFGWLAYTIYDNFLDEEGDIRTLSIANISLREVTRIFITILPKNNEFLTLFQTSMDTIDAANSWEIIHCRIKEKDDILKYPLPDFSNYTILVDKSIGHALGPLAILFALGYTKDSSEIQNLLSFFRHYLIARQLNDDAHDWESDLKKGHINPVNALILTQYRASKTKNKTGAIDIALPKLQEIFWYNIINEVCDIIHYHITKARESYKKISLIKHPEILERMLMPLEEATKKAGLESKSAISFIKTYKEKP